MISPSSGEEESKLLLLEELQIPSGQASDEDKENSISDTPSLAESSEESSVASGLRDMPPPRCTAVGPLKDERSALYMADDLSTFELKVRTQTIDKATGQSDYRLMISPAASMQEAYSRHQQLKSNNIESYVITQGSNKQAISLGVFSTRKAAEVALEVVAELDFPLEIVETPRIGREYWLVPNGVEVIRIKDSQWKKLVDERPDLGMSLANCIK